MRFHLKILGMIYVALGGPIAAFVLTALIVGALDSLGIIHRQANQHLGSALVIFAVLTYPALWIIQTGLALYQGRKSGRLYGIVIGAILLIGLNGILLLTKDPPDKAAKGFFVFHSLMILIGLYSLILLLPGRVKKYLQ
jgi:hypothetical protein